MKFVKKAAILFIAIIALTLSLVLIAAAAPTIDYSTNGAANRYGPGAELMLVGKVTDSGIVIPNAEATISVKVGGAEVHYAKLITDTQGYFRTRISIPSTATGTLSIDIAAIGQTASWSQTLGNPGSVEVLGFVDCIGYKEGEPSVTLPSGTRHFGFLFDGNVNYYNNRLLQGDLGLESLGINERNKDCFTLYKMNADGSFTNIGCTVNLLDSHTGGGEDQIDNGRINLLPGKDIPGGAQGGGRAMRDAIFVTPGQSFQPNTTYKMVIDGRLSGNSSATLGDDQVFFFKTSGPGNTETTTIPGGGGNGESSASAPQTDIPVTVDNDTGTVTVHLDTETKEALIADALAKAEEAKENAEEEQSEEIVPTVVFDLSAIENAAAATLDAEAAQTFSDAGVAVTLMLPEAEITISPEGLAELAGKADLTSTPITVQAVIVPMQELQGMQAAQVKGYETVVSINVFVGNEKYDVPLTVSLPYTLKPGEDPAAVRVWYMDDDGNLTDLRGVYDPDTGKITFVINHQSYFVVGYDPVSLWVNVFSDIKAGDWFYGAVAYANFHSLFEGVGGGLFAPQSSMTRAMFAQVLYNIEGAGGEGYSNTLDFSDIVADAWYFKAVSWAYANGIVEGFDGRFDPDRPITRQEMALMLYRYAEYKGCEIPANRDIPDFSDYSRISNWAESAARALAEAGVLSGSNGEFMPGKNATRAEVAQMFKNFMRFVAE